jgi:hypothetical protein
MAIDRKYGRVTTERGDIGEDEPVFVFRAQDQVTPWLLVEYEDLCRRAGSPQRHLDGIAAAREQIVAWQADHHTQVPQSAPVEADDA